MKNNRRLGLVGIALAGAMVATGCEANHVGEIAGVHVYAHAAFVDGVFFADWQVGNWEEGFGFGLKDGKIYYSSEAAKG